MPFLILAFFCAIAFAQVQGETPALTPFTSEQGTYLIAMPTYTYSRKPGTLGLKAEEETWRPDKWKNRKVFNRFVPVMDWEIRESSLWFYFGNELGDMLWQELSALGEESNRVPMLYGGFTTPLLGGFYAISEFNQIDHFSQATFETRKKRINNSQKFSWFGENLPAYSAIYGGFGYNSQDDFFKKASVLTGSEYLWAWNRQEWVPIRISPRVEGNAEFYFKGKEFELNLSTEKFQIQDSAAKVNNNLGFRLKGENTGGGLYTSRTEDKENTIAWIDFNHSFLQHITNKGVISSDLTFADSLEYKTEISKPSDLTLGILLRQNGVKLYSETSYKSKPLFMKVKAYQNYTENFESIGFDSEIAYKSSLAEAGAAYSREFFEYYREDIFYDIKPAESTAKLFAKYRFLQNLSFTHEWLYRNKPDIWFWNAQIEQKIPELNTSLYAVLLQTLSKNTKDFPFGGYNEARFFCGINIAL
ncbi:MAG: hypothetical protein LBC75_00105 [Fibromonadaceae bacterium]|nr:hypothetical protein [Fibromonadaceae bacterium]